MPIIIKDKKARWFRKGDYQLIPDSEVKNVPEDKRVRKIARIVYIYTISEFNAFYVKHVQRVPFGRYTVLVKNEIEKPTISEVRMIIYSNLIVGRFDTKRNLIINNLEKPYAAATWNSVLNNLITDANNQILFRDIKEINRKEIGKLQNKLEQNEYRKLIGILENVSESEYVVTHIYFIGKILVV